VNPGMKQTVTCEKCNAEISPQSPGIPPQVQNGQIISTAAMLNLRMECPECHTRYVSQIMGVQLQLGWTQVPEESRIIVPSVVPPRNLK
jgi:hypothetical protein